MATSSAHGALAKNCGRNGRMGVDGAVRAFAVNSVATGAGALAATLFGQDPMAGAGYAQSALNMGLAAWSRWKVCFAAGTMLETPEGLRAIETLRPGDLVLSRDEGDPDGPVVAKAVEELFVRTGRILHLHVGGQLIRTTAEHPFWVVGAGWVEAASLRAGDLLACLGPEPVAVEEVYDTGEHETVYNVRVADWHTYFVGGLGWAFSVWAHKMAKSLKDGHKVFYKVKVNWGTGKAPDSFDMKWYITDKIIGIKLSYHKNIKN